MSNFASIIDDIKTPDDVDNLLYQLPSALVKNDKTFELIKANPNAIMEISKNLPAWKAFLSKVDPNFIVRPSEDYYTVNFDIGETILHLAAGFDGGQITIPILLKRGADVNAQTNFGETPLRRAIANNKWMSVDELLKHPDINVDLGKPLQLAVTRFPRYIKKLIDAGASTDIRGLVISAVGPFGSLRNVRTLIDNKADVNTRGQYGITPLHVASFYERPDLVRALIEAEADVNAVTDFDSTPLHSVGKPNTFNDTPDDAAKVVKLLILAGADPNIVVGHYESNIESPLQIAFYRPGYESLVFTLERAAGLKPGDFAPEHKSQNIWEDEEYDAHH